MCATVRDWKSRETKELRLPSRGRSMAHPLKAEQQVGCAAFGENAVKQCREAEHPAREAPGRRRETDVRIFP